MRAKVLLGEGFEVAVTVTPPTGKSWYDVLGVSEDVSADDLKRSYRVMARKSHPDTGGSAEQFNLVSQAYEVLSNALTRREYDYSLRVQKLAAQNWGNFIPQEPTRSTSSSNGHSDPPKQTSYTPPRGNPTSSDARGAQSTTDTGPRPHQGPGSFAGPWGKGSPLNESYLSARVFSFALWSLMRLLGAAADGSLASRASRVQRFMSRLFTSASVSFVSVLAGALVWYLLTPYLWGPAAPLGSGQSPTNVQGLFPAPLVWIAVWISSTWALMFASKSWDRMNLRFIFLLATATLAAAGPWFGVASQETLIFGQSVSKLTLNNLNLIPVIISLVSLVAMWAWAAFQRTSSR